MVPVEARIRMAWQASIFGEHLGRGSGIGELMDDLGHALASGGDEILMLGGGQPAHLPEVAQVWQQQIEKMVSQPEQVQHVLSHYEQPIGNTAFRRSIASLLQREYGWSVGPENIAVTAGGQTALFFLFNMLAGSHSDGSHRQVLLPLIPEYIGYANQSVAGEMFRGVRPLIERLGSHQFKYRVDFDAIELDDRVGAICVSRPTNPTGNVLTDQEIRRLHEMAVSVDIPLLVDQAYGAPFPGVVFEPIQPFWDEQMILTLSLSKLGLPGTRTAVVVARPEVIDSIQSVTSIVGLANTNLGQALVQPLLDDGEISRLCQNVIRPFYLQKSQLAQAWIRDSFDDQLPYRIHVSEGAFFLWLWFEGLPIHSQELYERLKRRKVLVVPGHHFFFGLDEDSWQHRSECLRVSFSMPEAIVREGIRILAEEVENAYRAGK